MLEQYISNDYLRAGAILVGLFLILKVVVFLIQKIIVNLTSKTKTDLDDLLVKRTSKPLTLIILFIGLRITLEELPLTESLESTIYKIAFSLIIIGVSYLVYVIIDLVILRAWKRFTRKTKSNIDDSLVNLVHGFLKVVLFIFLFLYILDYWGIKIGPFLAGVGIGGIAIAFALQSSLNNIFGGIAIILDKTVKIGDLIYLDNETRGKVIYVGLRSTRIQTFDNEIIIVPNGIIANSKVQNIALPEPKVRVVVPFTVSYGSDIERVKKIVLREIKKVRSLINDPEPHVKFLAMGDSSLNFNAYFYVDSFENRLDATDQANTLIYNALNKAGISIPFNQLDVHIKKD